MRGERLKLQRRRFPALDKAHVEMLFRVFLRRVARAPDHPRLAVRRVGQFKIAGHEMLFRRRETFRIPIGENELSARFNLYKAADILEPLAVRSGEDAVETAARFINSVDAVDSPGFWAIPFLQ